MTRPILILPVLLLACAGGDDDSNAAGCTGPTAPGGASLADTTGFPRSAPAASWTAPEDGCADGYEIAVGADGEDDVLGWTSAGEASWDGGVDFRLPLDTSLTVSVRATLDGATSNPVQAGTFQVWDPTELPGLVL